MFFLIRPSKNGGSFNLTALRTKAETIEKSQGFFDTLTQLVKELWPAA